MLTQTTEGIEQTFAVENIDFYSLSFICIRKNSNKKSEPTREKIHSKWRKSNKSKLKNRISNFKTKKASTLFTTTQYTHYFCSLFPKNEKNVPFSKK